MDRLRQSAPGTAPLRLGRAMGLVAPLHRIAQLDDGAQNDPRALQEHGDDARRPYCRTDPHILPSGAVAARVHRERPRARARRHLQAADEARARRAAGRGHRSRFRAPRLVRYEPAAANTEGNRLSRQRRHHRSAERLRPSGKALRGGRRSIAHDSRRVWCVPAAADSALAQAVEGNRRHRTQGLKGVRSRGGARMDTDVLISGAGPTGLMLANQLARRGVRPIIIDRHSGPAQQTRAMAVQARTLEIYSKMGIIEQALALGARATGANMWANGRWTARIPLGDIGRSMSPFPFVLMLGQDDNEKIMGAKLHEHGLDVQWNTELIALKQREDCVDVTLTLPDGSNSKVTAAWVAGC